MDSYRDPDEAMNDDTGAYAEGSGTAEKVMGMMDVDENAPPNDNELATRDQMAHDNYNIKLNMVIAKVMYKPSVDTLYYNQREAVMTNVPEDLQLPVVFDLYNIVSRRIHFEHLIAC
jgi:hypothetical protein